MPGERSFVIDSALGMLILTNFDGFPVCWQTKSGATGEARVVKSVQEMISGAAHQEAIALINCNPQLTYQTTAQALLRFRRHFPIVAVDLVLRPPQSFRSRLFQPLRRFLLNRVDHFIHYFKDLAGYEAVFGITAQRSSFVPFKANLFGIEREANSMDGTYVLCIGRTLRDFDTFFSAMEMLPYPGAISQPDFQAMREHGARFTRTLDTLPQNVRVLADDGSREAMARVLNQAKIVVLPILKESMAASGSSTCLNAMLFSKCVIGTEGPGFSDVFENGEVVCVPSENPAALASAVKEYWQNNDKREKVALAGHRYALEAGGDRDLFQRIIESVVSWYQTEYRAR